MNCFSLWREWHREASERPIIEYRFNWKSDERDVVASPAEVIASIFSLRFTLCG